MDSAEQSQAPSIAVPYPGLWAQVSPKLRVPTIATGASHSQLCPQQPNGLPESAAFWSPRDDIGCPPAVYVPLRTWPLPRPQGSWCSDGHIVVHTASPLQGSSLRAGPRALAAAPAVPTAARHTPARCTFPSWAPAPPLPARLIPTEWRAHAQGPGLSHMAQGLLSREPETTAESVVEFQDVLELLEIQHKHTNAFLGKGSAPQIQRKVRLQRLEGG